jgi:hypothetical protein
MAADSSKQLTVQHLGCCFRWVAAIAAAAAAALPIGMAAGGSKQLPMQ